MTITINDFIESVNELMYNDNLKYKPRIILDTYALYNDLFQCTAYRIINGKHIIPIFSIKRNNYNEFKILYDNAELSITKDVVLYSTKESDSSIVIGTDDDWFNLSVLQNIEPYRYVKPKNSIHLTSEFEVQDIERFYNEFKNYKERYKY